MNNTEYMKWRFSLKHNENLSKYITLATKRNTLIRQLDRIQKELNQSRDDLSAKDFEKLEADLLIRDEKYGFFPVLVSFTVNDNEGNPYWHSSTTKQAALL